MHIKCFQVDHLLKRKAVQQNISAYFVMQDILLQPFVQERMMSLNSSVRGSGEEPDPAREERSGRVREVGSQAVWSLSSCKPGLSFVRFYTFLFFFLFSFYYILSFSSFTSFFFLHLSFPFSLTRVKHQIPLVHYYRYTMHFSSYLCYFVC